MTDQQSGSTALPENRNKALTLQQHNRQLKALRQYADQGNWESVGRANDLQWDGDVDPIDLAQSTLDEPSSPMDVPEPRPLTDADMIREADANYDLGRRHGKQEQMDVIEALQKRCVKLEEVLRVALADFEIINGVIENGNLPLLHPFTLTPRLIQSALDAVTTAPSTTMDVPEPTTDETRCGCGGQIDYTVIRVSNAVISRGYFCRSCNIELSMQDEWPEVGKAFRLATRAVPEPCPRCAKLEEIAKRLVRHSTWDVDMAHGSLWVSPKGLKFRNTMKDLRDALTTAEPSTEGSADATTGDAI